MNIRSLFLLLLVFPLMASGQYHISGRVTDILTHQPVANANVFLSSATAAAKTNEDGIFTITNVHGGHYDLVASFVGYVTYHQEVNVNADINKLELQLEAKITTLSEVKIGPDKDWDKNYQYFKRQFLGASDDAGDVKILNPQILSFHNDKKTREFTAGAYGFLEMENKALGYKIHYLLNNMTAVTRSYNEVSLYYEGAPSFEELPGKPSEVKRWKRKRLEAYQGSEMHFLRSVIANRVKEEGFMVRRLIRRNNPDYPDRTSQKYLDTLVDTALRVKDYFRFTDQKGEYALTFNNCLYITYHGQLSIITFAETYVYFDSNGVVINPRAAIISETWADSRMAATLPVDYEPSPL